MAAKDPLAIDAGAYRHLVQIQAPATTQTATGGPATTWTTFRETMAAIYGKGSRELYQAGELTSQVTHLVKVRWTADSYAAGQRVVYGTRIFKVQDVVDVNERHRVIALGCLELDGVI